mmetsp:Transcript_8675/g.15720  ORF Transcript_8675/g.15720 Transcript_8675/m.15720 type:complete len:142 (+) Transcript_8675:1892-2317(+)
MKQHTYFNSLQFPGLNEAETPLIAPNTAFSRQPAASDPGKHVGVELGLSLCVVMGSSTGASLGVNKGACDRSSVGSALGDTEEGTGKGGSVGLFVLLVGRGVGLLDRLVGRGVGLFDRLVGRSVGDEEGMFVGDIVGLVVG